MAKLYTNKTTYLNAEAFARRLKNLPVPISGLRPLAEAISTVGGISTTAIDDFFALHKNPSMYIIGEMLDWDAPTGGFLLQACFSTAARCASHLNLLQQQ